MVVVLGVGAQFGPDPFGFGRVGAGGAPVPEVGGGGVRGVGLRMCTSTSAGMAVALPRSKVSSRSLTRRGWSVQRCTVQRALAPCGSAGDCDVFRHARGGALGDGAAARVSGDARNGCLPVASRWIQRHLGLRACPVWSRRFRVCRRAPHRGVACRTSSTRVGRDHHAAARVDAGTGSARAVPDSVSSRSAPSSVSVCAESR